MLRIRGDLEDDSDLMDYIEVDDDLETGMFLTDLY